MEKLLTNAQVAAYLATDSVFYPAIAEQIYKWLESKEKDTK